MKHRRISAWILVVLVAAAFVMAAIGKLMGASTEMFAAWGYAAWFATLIGVLEMLGAIGLLIPRTTRFAVYGLTVIMLGAIYTHVANGEGVQVARPIIFTAALWAILWMRRPVERT